jgi:hypothetical protein
VSFPFASHSEAQAPQNPVEFRTFPTAPSRRKAMKKAGRFSTFFLWKIKKTIVEKENGSGPVESRFFVHNFLNSKNPRAARL